MHRLLHLSLDLLKAFKALLERERERASNKERNIWGRMKEEKRKAHQVPLAFGTKLELESHKSFEPR